MPRHGRTTAQDEREDVDRDADADAEAATAADAEARTENEGEMPDKVGDEEAEQHGKEEDAKRILDASADLRNATGGQTGAGSIAPAAAGAGDARKHTMSADRLRESSQPNAPEHPLDAPDIDDEGNPKELPGDAKRREEEKSKSKDKDKSKSKSE